MRYLIAFWNLENLFAPENHPGRPAWLQQKVGKDLQGWTPQLFDRKVKQLASILVQMKGKTGPDLLGCCELENAFALQAVADAMNQALPNRKYAVVHADAVAEQRGIDTAFIYDQSVLDDTQEHFSHFVMRRTGTRDIMQATFRTKAKGNELVAMSNHWPSRSGPSGPEHSAGYRMTAGETLGYWHDRIREVKGDDVAVLAMGDFNDDPFDRSVSIHAQGLRDRGDVERARSGKFYNLAWRYLHQPAVTHDGKARRLDGTLYFDGTGNVFDQLLASPGLVNGKGELAVVDATARIEAYPEMVSSSVNEGPIRFGLPKGDAAKNVNQDGFSDHFPVSVEVDEP